MHASLQTTLLIGFCLLLLVAPSLAQFGVKQPKEDAPQQEDNSMEADDDFNDPELMEAMEIFNAMSPEDMQEAMLGLLEAVGDDPEMLAAIQEVQKEIEMMKASGENDAGNLQDLIEDDGLAAASQDALDMLGSKDWESMWEMQEEILQGVLESDKLSAEEAALYKSDVSAWEKELKFIWNELQNQAQLQRQSQQKEQEL